MSPRRVDHLIQRSEWLTAYTPYQPEVSQGTLQMLFEFQTQVAKLTGMEVANASMYDGSTATAEAVLMARRLTRRNRVVLSSGLHPHYRDVVRSYVGDGPDLVVMPHSLAGTLPMTIDNDTAAIVVQTPDFYGSLRNVEELAVLAHDVGALLIVVVTEVVSLGLIEAPGALGADIVVCEGQSIGNALNFGGPYVGLMATQEGVHPPDARPPLRRDRRCRRQPRLRADALDPRAAHPPREGDAQHLHQLRPLRAGLLDPHGAARRGRPHAARAPQPRPRRARSPTRCSKVPGVELAQRHLLQRDDHPPAASRPRR